MQIFVVQSVGGFSQGGGTGGGVLHVVGLASEWSTVGEKIHFITNGADAGDQQYRGLSRLYRLPSIGVPGEASPLSVLVQSMLNHAVQWKKLREYVSSNMDGASLALATSPYPSDLLAALRLKTALGIPSAVYFHHLSAPPWWHPLRRGGIVRSTVNWLLTLFALSVTKMAGLLPILIHPEEVKKAGWRFSQVVPDPNFLDKPAASLINGQARPTAACFVSRLAPSKGVIDLLQVWRDVTERIPDAKLIIAGEAQTDRFERRTLRAIRRLQLDGSVELQGPITAEEKTRLLSQSRLFVFPSYEEGWSLAVMEAAYCGAVPVVYDLRAYDYLGPSLVKAPVGDTSAMAERSVELLQDPERLERLSGELRSMAASYSRKPLAQAQLEHLVRFVTCSSPHRTPKV